MNKLFDSFRKDFLKRGWKHRWPLYIVTLPLALWLIVANLTDDYNLVTKILAELVVIVWAFALVWGMNDDGRKLHVMHKMNLKGYYTVKAGGVETLVNNPIAILELTEAVNEVENEFGLRKTNVAA